MPTSTQESSQNPYYCRHAHERISSPFPLEHGTMEQQHVRPEGTILIPFGYLLFGRTQDGERAGAGVVCLSLNNL